jgi:branched-chain amino acid transport system substrate-binding protein
MNLRLKSINFLIVFFLIAGTLSACVGNTQTGTLTIAVAESDPGTEGKPNAHSLYAGALMAAEEVNQAGGIKGYSVKVVPYADGGNPSKAGENAKAIAQSDVLAVIGHSSSATTSAAATVYDMAGLTAINASPISKETIRGFPRYFDISYTSEEQGAYLANYVKRTMGINHAMIVCTSDIDASALSKKFKNTFQGLGGTIVSAQNSTAQCDLKEGEINTAISKIFSVADSGVLLIAANKNISADLVIELKNRGFNKPIIGGDNLSTRDFINKIEQENAEKAHPGYYTDGMISTRALLLDSAKGFTSQFVSSYQQKYNSIQISNSAARGYDAMLIILKALQTSQGNMDVAQKRTDIYTVLLHMDDPETTFEGVTGPMYFEPDRIAVRQTLLGVYQYGHLISAPMQYDPILLPERIQDLSEQIQKGHIIRVDGKYVYAINNVYTGIDIIEIREIDQKASTYHVDFYLWFRYIPRKDDPDFLPENIIYTNAVDTPSSDTIREETTDGGIYKTQRISGVFKNQFNYQAYPFDAQDLIVQFRNKNATASYIQYVVDRPGMHYADDDDLLQYLKDNNAFVSLFGWLQTSAHANQSLFSTRSTLGDPQNFGNKTSTDFSLFDIRIGIKRDALQFIIKSLLPLLITLVLAYITFYLPLGHSERLGVSSTALVTTAFFHLSLASALPEIGYTVAIEYFFYAAYVMTTLMVFLETISIRIETKANELQNEELKTQYEKRRKTLNTIGRILYPAIMFFVIGMGVFISNGTLDLNPKTEIITSAMYAITTPDATKATLTGKSVGGQEDNVILNLATWRPEDDDRIQDLIVAFERENHDIKVVHQPISGANYQEVLTIQFDNNEGPDLFFIPPFNTKYLANTVDLSSLPIEQHFEKDMRVPWRDNGIYYALPYVGVIQGIYYNKSIFNKLNLVLPTTWQGFLNTAKILKHAGYTPIANGLTKDEESDMFMTLTPNFIGGMKGRESYMSGSKGRCFNDPFAVRAFRSFEEIIPYMSADFTTVSSQTSKERFINQEAAMMFGGSWDLGYFSKKANFDWGVFAPPAPAGSETTVIFQPDIGIGINNQIPVARQKAALRFLQWLTTQQSLNLTNQILPGFYPLSNLHIQPEKNSHSADFQQLVQDHPTDLRWAYSQLSVTNQVPRASDLIQKGLYGIATRQLSPQEAADQLQAGMAEWYEPAQMCNKNLP